MQGRKPKGIFVRVEDCSDAEQSTALDAWYAGTRIPEATASGVFSNATSAPWLDPMSVAHACTRGPTCESHSQVPLP